MNPTDKISGKNQVGRHLSALGSVGYQTFDPKKNELNPEFFYEATSSEINTTIDLAQEASKAFSKTRGKERARFLKAIADEILSLNEILIARYCKESGLTKKRALIERTRTIFQLHSFAQLLESGDWLDVSIDTAKPRRKPIPKPDLRKEYIPLGPVVVFGASNFPLAYSTAGGDTASALAAGCPVIVKSHPMHSGTGELVAAAIIRAAEKTNMPNGVFSNLNSRGYAVGKSLVLHPKVKAVGFTGSLQGGRALWNLVAQREEPIPVFAEMGSINPVVLLPKALRKKSVYWVKTLSQSIVLDAGQFCTQPGLLLGIKGEDLDVFTSALGKELEKKASSCMLHPKIMNAFEDGKKQIIKHKEVKVIEKKDEAVSANYGKQTVVSVEGEVFLEDKNLHREVFGPFSMVVQCRDFKQLIKIIQQMEGQLTGSLIAEEDELTAHDDLVESLKNRVGRLIFNGVPTGVEVCPSMTHGGPYPATTDSRFTAVGVHAIKRWLRPVSYQNCPNIVLPDALKNENPLKIKRLVNGVLTRRKITSWFPEVLKKIRKIDLFVYI